MKLFSSQILIIIVFFTSCGNTSPIKLIHKSPLELSKISSIEILKNNAPPDTIKYFWKQLTDEQIKSFVNEWNKVFVQETRKYFPAFEIEIYLKDGSSRNFRATNKYIKEKTDWCFDFNDSLYFEKLYGAARLKGNQ